MAVEVGAVEVTGKRRFLQSVHLTRAIGIISIVGTHCWPGIPWTAIETDLLPLFFRSTTMILVFLSGFLFQYTLNNFKYKSHIPKRLNQLLIPYLVTSIPVLLVILFIKRREDVWPWVYDLPMLAQVGVFLVTGKHMAHLWYIPVAMLFIAMSPFFQVVDRHNLYKIVIPVTAIAATILGRDSVYGLFTIFGKAIFALPSFLFGMFFSRNYKNKEYLLINNAWIYSFLVGLLTYVYIFFPNAGANFLWIQKLSFAVMCICWFDLSSMKGRAIELLDMTARYSFPIYFIHGYAINLWRVFIDDGSMMWSGSSLLFVKVPYLLLKISVIVGFCLIVTSIIRSIFGRTSRYLIGV